MAERVFYESFAAVPVYDKPCGCDGYRRFIPHGVIVWAWGPDCCDDDLHECNQCGAVWVASDIAGDEHPATDEGGK